jgi:alkanesulfonate monooxygenase SsuD/methylene tetrahydromethanopterin reductase-like flavin-dependent oxidoreductase (luciferase family)
MKLGMTLPVMEPGVTRDRVRQWATTIDAGPFATLALGERIAFPNPEHLTTLAACAAWTERVEIASTITIAALHSPVLLAKQLATIDMLSHGRLTVGLGVGGRAEDYAAAGADLGRRNYADLAERVALMRRVWAGEKVLPELLRPVEPAPVQKGGPRLMAGALGPKAIRASAAWADGVFGFSFGPDIRDIEAAFTQIRTAWREAGRPEPRLVAGFWYALGDGARPQMEAHLTRYLNWMTPEAAAATARASGFCGSVAELRAFLRQLADIGAESVTPSPVTWDIATVHQFAEAAP